MTSTCGRVPVNDRCFFPCRRASKHDGPCAHDMKEYVPSKGAPVVYSEDDVKKTVDAARRFIWSRSSIIHFKTLEDSNLPGITPEDFYERVKQYQKATEEE